MRTSHNNPPSNGRIRLAIFCLYFCTGVCFSSWASRIPDIKTMLNLGDAAWGTILLMIPIGQICGMTISGLLISRIGSKNILPISLAGYVLALLFVGISATEYALIISLIIFGFFGNFCNISVNTQAVTLESAYNRPIMSSFHGGWSLAGLIGAAFGLLMSSLHIKPIYHFCAVGLIVLITLFINMKYLQADLKREKDPNEQAKKKRNKPETFLYLLGIIAFCGMAAEGAMSDWSALYLIDVVGTPKHLSPIGLAAYMITMASGRFVIDKATRRWGAQKVVQTGGLLIATGLFLAVALPYFISTIIGFMIIGFGTAGIVPTIYSIAGKRTKISTSIALTIVSSVSFLGFLIGLPLIGYISSVTNFRYSYALFGLFGICFFILVSRIKIFRKTD
mgnify:CR=1 FL=1